MENVIYFYGSSTFLAFIIARGINYQSEKILIFNTMHVRSGKTYTVDKISLKILINKIFSRVPQIFIFLYVKKQTLKVFVLLCFQFCGFASIISSLLTKKAKYINKIWGGSFAVAMSKILLLTCQNFP